MLFDGVLDRPPRFSTPLVFADEAIRLVREDMPDQDRITDAARDDDPSLFCSCGEYP